MQRHTRRWMVGLGGERTLWCTGYKSSTHAILQRQSVACSVQSSPVQRESDNMISYDGTNIEVPMLSLLERLGGGEFIILPCVYFCSTVSTQHSANNHLTSTAVCSVQTIEHVKGNGGRTDVRYFKDTTETVENSVGQPRLHRSSQNVVGSEGNRSHLAWPRHVKNETSSG